MAARSRQAMLAALATGLMMFGFGSDARAAFTISINNAVVATDNGVGDTDPALGRIEYTNPAIDGYNVQIKTETFASGTAAGISSTQLRVVRTGGVSPLLVEVDSDFTLPPGNPLGLETTFTRNTVAGFSTSGTTAMRTLATSSAGGGTGATPAVSFATPLGADFSNGLFNRTSPGYTLTSEVTITDLGIGQAVALTGTSTTSNDNPFLVPAPASALLLAAGLPVLGLARRKFRRA